MPVKLKRIRRIAGLIAALTLLTLLPAAAAEYYPPCEADAVSLADALEALGADGSYAFRAVIARENGLEDYRGTERQNLTLLRLLICGRLRRPADAAPLTRGLEKTAFIRQGYKTCKASAVAMALNLLLGRDTYSTEDLGGSCCRSVEGERFTAADGRQYIGVYRTDGYVGSPEELAAVIGEALDAGLPIAAAVHSVRGGTAHHWVLILGRAGEDYVVADPARKGSGSIADNASALSDLGYAFGLADYGEPHYGYVTFTAD